MRKRVASVILVLAFGIGLTRMLAAQEGPPTYLRHVCFEILREIPYIPERVRIPVGCEIIDCPTDSRF